MVTGHLDQSAAYLCAASLVHSSIATQAGFGSLGRAGTIVRGFRLILKSSAAKVFSFGWDLISLEKVLKGCILLHYTHRYWLYYFVLYPFEPHLEVMILSSWEAESIGSSWCVHIWRTSWVPIAHILLYDESIGYIHHFSATLSFFKPVLHLNERAKTWIESDSSRSQSLCRCCLHPQRPWLLPVSWKAMNIQAFNICSQVWFLSWFIIGHHRLVGKMMMNGILGPR